MRITLKRRCCQKEFDRAELALIRDITPEALDVVVCKVEDTISQDTKLNKAKKMSKIWCFLFLVVIGFAVLGHAGKRYHRWGKHGRHHGRHHGYHQGGLAEHGNKPMGPMPIGPLEGQPPIRCHKIREILSKLTPQQRDKFFQERKQFFDQLNTKTTNEEKRQAWQQWKTRAKALIQNFQNETASAPPRHLQEINAAADTQQKHQVTRREIKQIRRQQKKEQKRRRKEQRKIMKRKIKDAQRRTSRIIRQKLGLMNTNYPHHHRKCHKCCPVTLFLIIFGIFNFFYLRCARKRLRKKINAILKEENENVWNRVGYHWSINKIMSKLTLEKSTSVQVMPVVNTQFAFPPPPPPLAHMPPHHPPHHIPPHAPSYQGPNFQFNRAQMPYSNRTVELSGNVQNQSYNRLDSQPVDTSIDSRNGNN